MGMPIEQRLPFLDHRLVDYALSLPLTYSIRDGWLKWLLREAVADILPEEVAFRRRKLGFPFPLEAWLIRNKSNFFIAAGGATVPCPYIDVQRVAEGYDRLAVAQPALLWRAMSVCLWWKRDVLGEPLATGAHDGLDGYPAALLGKARGRRPSGGHAGQPVIRWPSGSPDAPVGEV
jgi:hypothetical protein